MPSGRDIHSVKPFEVPVLDPVTLEMMRAPPDMDDNYGEEGDSSDDETKVGSAPVGAYPGTGDDYLGRTASTSSYY
jgi:hypothetical protein